MADSRGPHPQDHDDTPRRAWPTVVAVLLAVALIVGAVLVLMPSPDKQSAQAARRSSGSPLPVATAGATPGEGPRGTASASGGGTGSVNKDGHAPASSGRATQAPRPLTSTAAPAHAVTAELARIESVRGQANVPGDIAGPALRITVEVKNASRTALPLSGTVVNLYYGRNNTPASPVSGPGARAFPTSAGPGSTAKGVYVFRVPTGDRSRIRVELDLSVVGDVVIFQGPAA